MSTKVYVTDYEYATLEPEKRELNKGYVTTNS